MIVATATVSETRSKCCLTLVEGVSGIRVTFSDARTVVMAEDEGTTVYRRYNASADRNRLVQRSYKRLKTIAVL